MKFCTIASGSKGNMLYIETKKTKLLLDVGISLKEAKKRVLDKNIDFSSIDVILISHEHSDHTRYLPTFLKQTNAKLYINKSSFLNLPDTIKYKLDKVTVNFIEENTKYVINDDLEIYTLRLPHDSVNNFGFIFVEGKSRLAYFTDTGYIPLKYVNLLKDVDALILECNHDITMLLESDRPAELKQRILSPYGHMSNQICLQILNSVLNERHKVILLAHVSEDCNSPDLILKDVILEAKKICNTNIEIASQYEASKIYEI